VQSFVDMSQEGSDTLSTMQAVEGTVRSGSAPILSDLVLPTQPSNNSLRDVPVSTGSDWSSSGTTPPLPPARRDKEHKEKESSPKLTHSRQSSTHSRSSHSKSPQAESPTQIPKRAKRMLLWRLAPRQEPHCQIWTKLSVFPPFRHRLPGNNPVSLEDLASTPHPPVVITPPPPAGSLTQQTSIR